VQSASRLRLSESDRERLIEGAAALGVALDATKVAKLGAFADLLGLWSGRMNLIACASSRELVERHLLDSLALESLLPEAGTLVDLGSGAGFPGVPLAVGSESRRTILVEPRRRRATFLREVRRALSLENVEVAEERAEAPSENRVGVGDAIVVRAVWSRSADLAVARGWLRPEGHLFWMRGDQPSETVVDGLIWERRTSYRIGSAPSRSIEIFRVAAA
jgi:16S rRNA (guanine527-N7)-methyltransferase